METPENIVPTAYNGALGAAIARSSNQVRDERARAIVEETRLVYRRRIEDKAMEVRQMENKQAEYLDLAPDNTHCLISAKSFNAEAFVATNVSLALGLKKAKEDLDILQSDFTRLFGEPAQLIL